jgi:hypothetical protein
VRVEQDGDAAGLEGQHQVPDVGPAERVQSAGRLVEDDELRAGHQRDGQPEPLLHALGEAAHPVAGTSGQAHQGQALSLLLGRDGDAGQADVQPQHLGGGEPRLVPEELRQVPDPGPRLRVARRPSQQQHLTGVGPDEAEQHLDRAGLAGTVRAEQTQHLAAPDAERHVVDRGPPSVPLAQAGAPDRG